QVSVNPESRIAIQVELLERVEPPAAEVHRSDAEQGDASRTALREARLQQMHEGGAVGKPRVAVRILRVPDRAILDGQLIPEQTAAPDDDENEAEEESDRQQDLPEERLLPGQECERDRPEHVFCQKRPEQYFEGEGRRMMLVARAHARHAQLPRQLADEIGL